MDYGDLLDNVAYNAEETQDLKDPIDHIMVEDTSLKIYRSGGDLVEDQFADTLIRAYFQYRKVGEEIHLKGIWNARHAKGLCFRLMFQYYLPHYFVISDNTHSSQGEAFWKRCIGEAERRNLPWAIIKDGIETDIPLENVWGKEAENFQFQIRINRLSESVAY